MPSASDTPPPPEHFPQSTDRLGRSASVAGVATLTSRILGLVRDTVLAAVFGAGNDMDAFIVAFRIPNLVRDLFAEGAMSAAFVPTFTQHLTLQGKARRVATRQQRPERAAARHRAAGRGRAVVVTRPLVTAYAGDYALVPGKLDLTITLTRIMLPFLTLAAIAAAVMGMLNSLRHYFVPALSPAAFNVATIACALLADTADAGDRTAAHHGASRSRAILGGLGQIAVQWPSLRREGFRYAPCSTTTIQVCAKSSC